MYNLMMVGAKDYWENKVEEIADYETSRFMEHTSPSICAQFGSLTNADLKELSKFPTLFAYEFPSKVSQFDENDMIFARVGKIVELRADKKSLLFNVKFSEDFDPIPILKVFELAQDLGIDLKNRENYRTHWAIKDVNLLAVLNGAGLQKQASPNVSNSAGQPEAVAISPLVTLHDKPKVFIVHGHDIATKSDVARWINRIGLDDVILHEQPNLGRTIITKFQDVADVASFALVIMSPDDVGGALNKGQLPRARQNVILELGYFLGKLGPKRVAALVVGAELEKPSDFDGVVYIQYDARGAWKIELAREFSELGIPFDRNRIY